MRWGGGGGTYNNVDVGDDVLVKKTDSCHTGYEAVEMYCMSEMIEKLN